MHMKLTAFPVFCVVFVFSGAALCQDISEDRLSPQTRACIGCHGNFTPGIVKDWMSSKHAKTLPGEAMKKAALEKRISAEALPKKLLEHVVGCYECHSRNLENHKDAFEHMGRRIQVVVSPDDCKTCHPVEAGQFFGSKKAYAYKNLMENPLYLTLVNAVTGVKKIEGKKIITEKPTASTLHETCLGCHGTIVEPRGLRNVATKIGNVPVPELTNWPNQGVGRVNPDGSRGACTACHARHSFSIEVARKPYTCSQCHLEPDVPAWNVYDESKHGDIFFSQYHEWNLSAVPWVLGQDFKTPTCSACHNSLVVSPAGEVITERSHDFGARLWVRIFGLIYSHPQPRSGDTTIIKNKDGLPLPASFAGEPASDFLIDAAEQGKRMEMMKSLCKGCHSTNWTDSHFAKFEKTLKDTNEMTLSSTKVMGTAWARGLEDKTNPFDEPIEHMWVRQWVFYSNSIRYASAMTGAPDYTAFKNGWWYLAENLEKMHDSLELKENIREMEKE
ncbi:MAG: multiheme c-type cytochrome [Nitrospirota bacterium]